MDAASSSAWGFESGFFWWDSVPSIAGTMTGSAKVLKGGQVIDFGQRARQSSSGTGGSATRRRGVFHLGASRATPCPAAAGARKRLPRLVQGCRPHVQ